MCVAFNTFKYTCKYALHIHEGRKNYWRYVCLMVFIFKLYRNKQGKNALYGENNVTTVAGKFSISGNLLKLWVGLRLLTY